MQKWVDVRVWPVPVSQKEKRRRSGDNEMFNGGPVPASRVQRGKKLHRRYSLRMCVYNLALPDSLHTQQNFVPLVILFIRIISSLFMVYNSIFNSTILQCNFKGIYLYTFIRLNFNIDMLENYNFTIKEWMIIFYNTGKSFFKFSSSSVAYSMFFEWCQPIQ